MVSSFNDFSVNWKNLDIIKTYYYIPAFYIYNMTNATSSLPHLWMDLGHLNHLIWGQGTILKCRGFHTIGHHCWRPRNVQTQSLWAKTAADCKPAEHTRFGCAKKNKKQFQMFEHNMVGSPIEGSPICIESGVN